MEFQRFTKVVIIVGFAFIVGMIVFIGNDVFTQMTEIETHCKSKDGIIVNTESGPICFKKDSVIERGH